MAGAGDHLVRREHPRLAVKEGFEFRIVDLRVPGGDDQDAAVAVVRKREGFGDAGRLDAERLRGEFDGRAGNLELPHGGIFVPLLQILFDGCHGHDRNSSE